MIILETTNDELIHKYICKHFIIDRSFFVHLSINVMGRIHKGFKYRNYVVIPIYKSFDVSDEKVIFSLKTNDIEIHNGIMLKPKYRITLHNKIKITDECYISLNFVQLDSYTEYNNLLIETLTLSFDYNRVLADGFPVMDKYIMQSTFESDPQFANCSLDHCGSSMIVYQSNSMYFFCVIKKHFSKTPDINGEINKPYYMLTCLVPYISATEEELNLLRQFSHVICPESVKGIVDNGSVKYMIYDDLFRMPNTTKNMYQTFITKTTDVNKIITGYIYGQVLRDYFLYYPMKITNIGDMDGILG